MSLFSFPCSHGVVGAPSCCSNLPTVMYDAGKGRVLAEKFSFIGNHSRARSLSYLSSARVSFNRREKIGVCYCCNKVVVSKVSCDDQRRNGHVGMGRKLDPKKRNLFSLRLRPKFHLILVRLKKLSLQGSLEKMKLFLHKNLRSAILVTSVVLALGMCALFLKVNSLPAPKTVPYSDLIADLRDECVSEVLFEEGSRRIFYNKYTVVAGGSKSIDVTTSHDIDCDDVPETSTTSDTVGLRGKASKSFTQWQYSTRKIDHDESFLLSLMREKGTTYSSAPQSLLTMLRNLLITVLSLWIPLTPLMWLLYRQFSAANSPAKKLRSTPQMVSFDDVEGVDVAKAELMEIVSCLQGSINYTKLGAKLPRGILLVGPPGTGKTLLARAVAGEAGIPFFSVSASEFVELFVGRGAARIRDLFKVAQKYAPSIIFIDELDAVGGKRGRSFNDERDQTLNQLLTEMDGFESDMKIIVIAATNRPEALDPALCRPGRFSRKVLVGEPDLDGRKRILYVHLRGVLLEEDPQDICNFVASLTPGLVGADLANIVNEAALLAARRGGETVTREDIMVAVERTKFGINDRRLTPSAISKSLERLFPWMPSLLKRLDVKDGGLEGFMGYQTLS